MRRGLGGCGSQGSAMGGALVLFGCEVGRLVGNTPMATVPWLSWWTLSATSAAPAADAAACCCLHENKVDLGR